MPTPDETPAARRKREHLAKLIEKAREHVMTPAEVAAQRKSWVCGEMLLRYPTMNYDEAAALFDAAAPPPQEHVPEEKLEQNAGECWCCGQQIGQPPQTLLTIEDLREQILATVVAPDNGAPREVLLAVLECANAWVPEARIIGNVRAGDIARALRASLSPQTRMSGDLGITKEWFERRAKAETDLEIGAGFSVVTPTDADLAQMEVLAERALPQWAQDELARLRAALAATEGSTE